MTRTVATFTSPDGAELVVLTRADFDALVAGEDEDRGTARIIRETSATIERGEDVAIPETVWDDMPRRGKYAAIRAWRQLTQSQVARAVGISQPFYSQIERGVREPSLQNVVQIARALRVPVDVLVD